MHATQDTLTPLQDSSERTTSKPVRCGNAMTVKNKDIVFSAVVSALLWGVLAANGFEQALSLTAALTLLIAILWVTEALPIPVTSLIPFVAFPMAGVIDYKEAASALGSHVILLLMGAFMLSKALEKSGVHRRIAVYMLRLCGASSAKRLVLGFMLTSAVLSMWISNTATTLMLLPIAMAIITALAVADCGSCRAAAADGWGVDPPG